MSNGSDMRTLEQILAEGINNDHCLMKAEENSQSQQLKYQIYLFSTIPEWMGCTKNIWFDQQLQRQQGFLL